MPIQNYEWKSDFARKYVGQGKAAGKVESLLTVLSARGFAVGDALEQRVWAERDLEVLEDWIRRAVAAATLDEVFVGKGKAEGKLEGKAESLLTVLQARGFAVEDALEQRVRAERDLEVLEDWIRSAVAAATLDEVFA